MSDAIPVALIGTGFSASIYAEALRDIPALKLVSVAGRELSKAKELAERAGISHCTDDLYSVLSSSSIAGVILAVPPFVQPPLAIQAFLSRKHVLCEKPLAVTSGEAEGVSRVWRESGCIGITNFCYRIIPEFVELKQRVQAGECGDMQSIHVEWVLSSRLNRSLTYNWKNQGELGGGVLQNYGVHVVDYLFHDQPVVAVGCAIKSVYVNSRPDEEGREHPVTADENLTAIFRLGNSVAATMHLSVVTTPPIGHRIVMRGSAGTLELLNPNPRSPAGPFYLYRCVDSEKSERVLLRVGSPRDSTMASLFKRTLGCFVESIRTGTHIGPSIADGLKASKLVDAIGRAAVA